MSKVKIHHKGLGDATIHVDGKDIARHVRGYAVYVENPNDKPTVVLSLGGALAPDTELDDAVVMIHEEQAALLERLGWTRPDVEDPTENRPDDDSD